MNKIDLVIFDIDGTLIDTTELFLQAYEYVIRQHNLGHKTREELKQIIVTSKTILESYKTLLPSRDVEEEAAGVPVAGDLVGDHFLRIRYGFLHNATHALQNGPCVLRLRGDVLIDGFIVGLGHGASRDGVEARLPL